jgi:hypothetical protein
MRIAAGKRPAARTVRAHPPLPYAWLEPVGTFCLFYLSAYHSRTAPFTVRSLGQRRTPSRRRTRLRSSLRAGGERAPGVEQARREQRDGKRRSE